MSSSKYPPAGLHLLMIFCCLAGGVALVVRLGMNPPGGSDYDPATRLTANAKAEIIEKYGERWANLTRGDIFLDDGGWPVAFRTYDGHSVWMMVEDSRGGASIVSRQLRFEDLDLDQPIYKVGTREHEQMSAQMLLLSVNAITLEEMVLPQTKPDDSQNAE